MCVRRAKTQKGAEESPKEITAKKPPEATTDVNLMHVQFLAGEDSLEEGMATRSSIIAWRIPRTEDLGRLQSIRSLRVGHE